MTSRRRVAPLRYWNPIWGDYLGRDVNAPLRRVMPAAPAVIATFVVSGAIHDAAIFVAPGSPKSLFVSWFAVFALMAVISMHLALRYRFRAWTLRAVINVALVGVHLGSSRSESGFWVSGSRQSHSQ